MSASAIFYTPHTMGYPSSPLNPHALSSSSPLTSPTPLPSSSSTATIHHPQLFRSPTLRRAPHTSSSSSTSTRYARPSQPSRRATLPATHDADVFNALGEGSSPISPVEGQLWKDRLARRHQERERRKHAREAEVQRRRGRVEVDPDSEDVDRKMAEDDEEIFRRIMILQKRRAQHAQLVDNELAGGSDPITPDFWDDPSSSSAPQEYDERDMYELLREEEQLENEMWREAEEAEEAEREAAEAEMARMVEEEYLQGLHGTDAQRGRAEHAGGHAEQMDWEMDG